MTVWLPNAEDYFANAKELNEAARLVLRLETRNATANQAKISIGLSLQAAELVGKGLLLLAGVTRADIRKKHSKHKILDLLKEAQNHLLTSKDHRLKKCGHFLSWQPIIQEQSFGSTIGQYLEDHFAQGDKACPRSYFYPDHEQFTGPVPIQALYIMVDYMIQFAENAAAAVM